METKREIPDQVRQYLQENGRKGGESRKNSMTPEERKALGRKAALARWNKNIPPVK